MDLDHVKGVYEATEASWEATAAQWVTVFDAVTKESDGSLTPIEQAVWNAYTQARELRKLVSSLWLEAQSASREATRREAVAEFTPAAESDRDSWIFE